jgi:hypothetical protein
MDSMNMKTSEKPNGRPKGSKNKLKPKPKFRALQTIDIIEEYKREINKVRAKAS